MQLMHMLNGLYSSSSSRRLPVLALGNGVLHLSHEPRRHQYELPHEIADVDDEVADDGKVAERLDADRAGRVVGEEGGARQLGLAVDGHPAASADPHAARPPVRERPVQVVLDVIQAVEHDPVLRARHLVLVEGDARSPAQDDTGLPAA